MGADADQASETCFAEWHPKFASKLRAVAIRAPLRFQRIAVGLLFATRRRRPLALVIQITLARRGIC
jgi:hypothetical protein